MTRSREGELSDAWVAPTMIGMPRTGHLWGMVMSSGEMLNGTPALPARAFAARTIFTTTPRRLVSMGGSP